MLGRAHKSGCQERKGTRMRELAKASDQNNHVRPEANNSYKVMLLAKELASVSEEITHSLDRFRGPISVGRPDLTSTERGDISAIWGQRSKSNAVVSLLMLAHQQTSTHRHLQRAWSIQY